MYPGTLRAPIEMECKLIITFDETYYIDLFI